MAVYDDNILIKVRNWGALKYSPDRIIIMLGLKGDERDAFLIDITDTDHRLYSFYHKGINIGEYNIDIALREKAEEGDTFAEAALRERQQQQSVEELRRELFGI